MMFYPKGKPLGNRNKLYYVLLYPCFLVFLLCFFRRSEMDITLHTIILALVNFLTSTKAVTTTGQVLFLTIPRTSHMYTMLILSRDLELLGYRTSIVLSEDQAKHKILKEFDVDIVVSAGMTRFQTAFKDMDDKLIRSALSGSKEWLRIIFQVKGFCQAIAGDEELINSLGKVKFDVAVIDGVITSLCMSVIPYKLSVPFIQFGTILETQNMRVLTHPAVYPAHVFVPFSDRMTYLQRLGNTLLHLALLIAPDPVNPRDVVGTFAPERPHLTNEELRAKTSLYLLHTDELIDYHLPLYPNMISVGGLTTRRHRPLAEEMKNILDSADKGVVVVSFGTIVKDIPKGVLNNLMGAFREFSSLRFVFRYGNVTREDANIIMLPWLSQGDFLGHSNTKLFISHCGSNGQFEALYHAVPILCLPVFGDQHYNAVRIREKGFGLSLRVCDFTSDELIAAIKELLENPTYKENIHKASTIFKSRLLTPAQRAAWWIDHVIKYGGDHLRPAIVDLPYYQFLLVDVFVGMLFILLLFSLTCTCACRCIYRACSRLKPSTNKPKEELHEKVD